MKRGVEPIEVSPKEYAVIEYIMSHPGRVMSRTLITEYAWGYNFDPGTNIVDVVINHLRKKIDAKSSKKLISTVRGVAASGTPCGRRCSVERSSNSSTGTAGSERVPISWCFVSIAMANRVSASSPAARLVEPWLGIAPSD